MDGDNSAPQQNTQPQPHAAAGDNSTILAILAYLGPLVILSYLLGKDNAFVKFHVQQGFVLFAIEVILWVLSMTMFMWSFWMILRLIHLGVIILSIVGIVRVIQKKQEQLPLVGGFARHFNF